MLKKIRQLVVYPWLLVLYPIFYLYSQNIAFLRQEEVLAAAGVGLLVVSLLVGLVYLLLKNIHAAALLVAVWLVAFFSYGHVFNLLDLAGGVQQLLLPVMVLLALFLSYTIIKQRDAFATISGTLNLVAAVLLGFTLWPLGQYYASALQHSPVEDMIQLDLDAAVEKVTDSPERPDIYHIILDGYSSNNYWLRKRGYDNSAFTDALEARGFYVAYDSKSSYGMTMASLPSTFNMRYLDPAEVEGWPGWQRVDYGWLLFANNLVAQKLMAEYGYTYHFIMSGLVPPSSIADVNVDFTWEGVRRFSGDEIDVAGYGQSWNYKQSFWPFLLETTMFRPLADRFDTRQSTGAPYHWLAPERVFHTIDELKAITALEEATFTIGHIMLPHDPVRFDREGNLIDQETVETDHVGYFYQQVEYLNAITLDLVDTIIANSDVPPIIILQGDHGSDLGYSLEENGSYRRFEILSAFYWPGEAASALTQSIVPVNEYRLLFNEYFGSSYEMLEPHHYDIPKGFDDIFFFVEQMQDGRLNAGAAEHIAILLPGEDESGSPVINVHTPAADGSAGEIMLTITQEDIAAYVDTPPAENTILWTQGPVMLIALDTGEFQINLGPDQDGRVWSVVFDGIPARLFYGFEIDYGG